jgi:hypothetical protein
MYIDPANKAFLAVFFIVIFGTVGFFIASIFLDFSGDEDVQTVDFENSDFHVNIKRLKSDGRYVVQVFGGRMTVEK